MLLLEMAIAVVHARKMAVAQRVRALEDCPGTMDCSVVPFSIFFQGKALSVFTIIKIALERPLVCVGMLTRFML
jgi:hypothetical protein